MENIYVFGFATFGHPNDFRQSCFFPKDRKININVKLFDLSNAIKVFPESELYSIRKENLNGVNAISYAKYTFVKEMSSERDGTFIGSSILYTNGIVNEAITIEKLNKFHSDLEKRNIKDGKLIVNHSDEFNYVQSSISDFDKLGFNMKKVEEPTNFNISNSSVLVYSSIKPESLQQSFKKGLELLNYYDTIFFTDNEDIVKFTVSKRLYKFLDESKKEFSTAIQTLQEEKKKKLELLTNEFEKELKDLEEKRKDTIRDLKQNIEENSRKHQDNSRKIEESKKQINIAENNYNEYSRKIREAISFIKAGKKTHDVRLFYNENKLEFINYINQNIKPEYLNDLNNIQAKTSLTINHQPSSVFFHQNGDNPNDDYNEVIKPFKIFKLLSIIFFTLWLSTFIYYNYFKIPSINEVVENQEKIVNQDLEKETLSENYNNGLSPKPNNKLDTKEVNLISKSLNRTLTIKDVVTIIFTKNPSDIKKHYENQIDQYSKIIIEQNKDNFEEIEGKTYYKQGEIKQIPSFKSDK